MLEVIEVTSLTKKKELRVKKKKLLQKPQLVFFKQKKAFAVVRFERTAATKRRNSQLSVNFPYTRPKLNINKRKKKKMTLAKREEQALVKGVN